MNALETIEGLQPQARLGLGLLGLVVAIALLAPVLAPFDPLAADPAARLLPPLTAAGLPGAAASSQWHLLGTDSVGRDILSRLMFGGRLSLLVGIAAAVIGAAAGSLIGCVSGYFGGWWDAMASFLIDLQLSFPFVLLAIFLLGSLGGGTVPVVLILALGTWVNHARVVRAQVLSLRSRGYVEAARVSGAGSLRVLLVHILPNTLSPICVMVSFSMAQAILTEAGLSFLGIGLDPSTPSWGTMLNDGRDYLQGAWWISTMPGLAIGVTVLAVTLVGEGLRRWLDEGGNT
jgi:peptide/nickel transport system permease protein